LDYFKKLEKADTESVEPIGHITGSHSVFRDDVVSDCAIEIKEEIINNFPDKQDNQAKVKSILVAQ
jgi:aspartyl/glutamyl-tRNA(Asn/Gln) amidotransferase C subunit